MCKSERMEEAKKNLIKNPLLCICFLDVVKHRTAGNPQDEEIFWTHFSVKEIQKQMSELGSPVSPHDVCNLMSFF